jgi:hypothetical protein
LINNAYACKTPIFGQNSTEKLEGRAVYSVSEDAIDAQIELAQRYRDGYQPTLPAPWYGGNGLVVTRTSHPCDFSSPEREIYSDQSMADYWAKFTSVTKIILLAKNGDVDARLELRRLYLNRGDEHDMINLFSVNPIIGVIEKHKSLWRSPSDRLKINF